MLKYKYDDEKIYLTSPSCKTGFGLFLKKEKMERTILVIRFCPKNQGLSWIYSFKPYLESFCFPSFWFTISFFSLFSPIFQFSTSCCCKNDYVRRTQTTCFLLNLKTLLALFLLYLQNSSQSFWGLGETLFFCFWLQKHRFCIYLD